MPENALRIPERRYRISQLRIADRGFRIFQRVSEEEGGSGDTGDAIPDTGKEGAVRT